MNILILGGTPTHRGGIELFCERAREALTEIGGHHAEYVYSYGPYLRQGGLVSFVRGILALATRPRPRWDCIWLQYGSLPDLVLLVICRLLGFRVLVTPHVGSNFASQSSPVMRCLSKWLLSTADGIGLLSASQAEELTLPQAPPRFKIFTFLPRKFPAPSQPCRGPDMARLRLVHAGRLSKGKGSFLFIDVCAILLRSGSDFEADLIGPCPEATRQELNSAIALAGLTGRVNLIGPLQEAELLARLACADVLVHLSEIDSFPLIVLESIGCGVFPMCRDLPGARQMAHTYCGQIVTGRELPEQVSRLLIEADPGHFGRLAAAASLELRRDFDWSKCVDAVEQALAQLSLEARAQRASSRSLIGRRAP